MTVIGVTKNTGSGSARMTDSGGAAGATDRAGRTALGWRA